MFCERVIRKATAKPSHSTEVEVAILWILKNIGGKRVYRFAAIMFSALRQDLIAHNTSYDALNLLAARHQL